MCIRLCCREVTVFWFLSHDNISDLSDVNISANIAKLFFQGGYSETCDILIEKIPNLFEQLISMVSILSFQDKMVSKTSKVKTLHILC